MGTIFLHCHKYFSRSPSSRIVETYFSVQKKKYYSRVFFPASGIRYSHFREACLNLLLLLFRTLFFRVSWKRSFEMNPSFLLVETDFLSSGNHFSSISQIPMVNQVKTNFSWFFQLLTVEPVFPAIPVSGNVLFLTNPSLRLVEWNFLSSGGSIILFTAFSSACGNHY